MEDVFLKRFKDGKWSEVPISLIGETEEFYRFEAGTDGFSYYAIGLRDSEAGSGVGDTNESEKVGETSGETDEEKGETSGSVNIFNSRSVLIAVIVIFVLMGVILFWKKKEVMGGSFPSRTRDFRLSREFTR